MAPLWWDSIIFWLILITHNGRATGGWWRRHIISTCDKDCFQCWIFSCQCVNNFPLHRHKAAAYYGMTRALYIVHSQFRWMDIFRISLQQTALIFNSIHNYVDSRYLQTKVQAWPIESLSSIIGRQKNNYRPNLFNSKLDLNAGEAILPIDFSFNWENDRLAADKVSVSDIDNV